MTTIASTGLSGVAYYGPLQPSAARPSATIEAIAGVWSWPFWLVEVSAAAPEDVTANRALFIEITVFDRDDVLAFVGPLAPAAASPSVGWGFEMVGATTKFYVGTRDVITDSDHTPPDEGIPGAVIDTLNFRAITFDGIEPINGPPSFSRGSLRVRDLNDQLAHWCDRRYSFHGWPLIMRRGNVVNRRPTSDPSTWPIVGSFYTAGLTWDAKAKMIGLRDIGGLLALPALLRTFKGTDGAEGDANMAGKFKPRAFGRGFYCAPILWNAALLCYKLNDGPIYAAPDVYDGGSRLGAVTYPDYETIALMMAATLAPGDVVTCLATGDFRLGGRAQFTVVAYCNGGDATGSYVETRGGIAMRIATDNAGYSLDTMQLDTASFTRFNAAHAAACGFYFDNNGTVGDAITEVLVGVLGTWIVGATGLLSIGYLGEPAETPAVVVDARRILGDQIEMKAPHVPRWQTLVGWRRNYTPLPAGQRAGILELDEEEIRLWGGNGSFAERSDQSVLTANPFAVSAVVVANFALEVDARAEAVRQNALLSVTRRRVSFPAVQGDPFYPWQWKTIQFTGIDLFQWGDEINMLCVGTGAAGGAGIVSLEGWF